ncbi:hypothetical protein [Leucobacter manosquensis]|uniref:Uncharacterized protein n=1 Tax=Leucobacter manosquensis TaxID=2810611 RepID=A0ABS5M5D1_9MICO|nr:hypothetical protein [Leucobacter manosquensis]MBS3182407.1 hypothetical protein [Leucobacter manosquensis]
MKTTVWYCDACHEEIYDLLDALVTWRITDAHKASGFAITHQGPCDIDANELSLELTEFLGEDGLERLLALLSHGPFLNTAEQPKIADMDAFVDFFRRLQTPGYEEARLYFDHPTVKQQVSEANGYAPYTRRCLEWIIDTGRASN